MAMKKSPLVAKWSQVQILSARPKKPALTSIGAGFVCFGLGGSQRQWASSVPSGGEWAGVAQWSPVQCGAGGAQILELGIGVDRE
jgi:hypothetical protein